jgi:hypothetical protein
VASQRFGGLEFSTDPCQLYVSYLTADQLAASIQRIDHKLLTMPRAERRKRGELLKSIRRDLAAELGARQLTLICDWALGEGEFEATDVPVAEVGADARAGGGVESLVLVDDDSPVEELQSDLQVGEREEDDRRA